MEFVYKSIFLFICGLQDSFRIYPIKRYIVTSHRNSQRIFQILGQSFIHLFIYFILSIAIMNLLSNSSLFQKLKELSQVAETILFVLYYVFWLGPLYLITTIYTFFWFGDIANLAFEIERDHYRVKIVQAKQSIETMGANALKKIVFMIVYMILSISAGIFLGMIPYIGKILIIMLYSFYYSLFLFMLKWNYNPYILSYFEQYAAYFLGFGLMYSWFTNLFTGALNDGMYWILFPIYIFNSTCTQPPYLKDLEIKSFSQLKDLIQGKSYQRSNVSYDEHLKQLRDDPQYKKQCLKQGSIFQIVRKLTNKINDIIGKYLIKQTINESPESQSSQISSN
ncbi:hypothetical protein ABPG72_002791 [Tetrahymena utriculariae]